MKSKENFENFPIQNKENKRNVSGDLSDLHFKFLSEHEAEYLPQDSAELFSSETQYPCRSSWTFWAYLSSIQFSFIKNKLDFFPDNKQDIVKEPWTKNH